MKVQVRLFARAKDLARSPSVEVHLPEGATVGLLRQQLAASYPALAGLLERSAIAVEEEFAGNDALLPPEAVVALLPPVSGGQ